MIFLIQFFTGIGSAISVKLCSSVDDVLWLSTFLTNDHSFNTRLQNSLVYFSVCFLQTCLAFFISTSGTAAIDKLLNVIFKEKAFSSEKLLILVSGIGLGIYSFVLAYEYYEEEVLGIDSNFGSKEETDGYDRISTVERETLVSEDKFELDGVKNYDSDMSPNAVGTIAAMNNSAESSEIDIESNTSTTECSLNVGESQNLRKTKKEARSLLVIAFLGSLDDLTLFVPLLVGKTFGAVELVIGAMIATLIIIFLCLFLVQCKLIADILQKVPLFAIVFAFSLALLVRGTMIE